MGIPGLRAMARTAPRPVRAATWGTLDGAPPPHGPDPAVFGTWRPHGEPPAIVSREWECCGVRGAGDRCWNCGRA